MANKNDNKAANSAFYTRLLVSRRRQVTLGILMFIYFGLIGSLLFRNITDDISWMAMAVPITIAGALFIFFPQTEEWEYKAWQNKQQKQERLFLN